MLFCVDDDGMNDLLFSEALTRLFEGREDGPSARVLRVGELHDAVVVCLKKAKHGAGIVGI